MNGRFSIDAAAGLVLAVSVGVARSEKVWAESAVRLPVSGDAITVPHQGYEPFDPRRVPQSGGMASRLLAGISVKHG
ncbi:hypothetical protein [Aestuariivirga sp.]|uniref:hypothetical protein n=1 Tax=Aestuariivirga sp. TaxID=2650926 RepID=UPI0039E3FC88